MLIYVFKYICIYMYIFLYMSSFMVGPKFGLIMFRNDTWFILKKGRKMSNHFMVLPSCRKWIWEYMSPSQTRPALLMRLAISSACSIWTRETLPLIPCRRSGDPRPNAPAQHSLAKSSTFCHVCIRALALFLLCFTCWHFSVEKKCSLSEPASLIRNFVWVYFCP